MKTKSIVFDKKAVYGVSTRIKTEMRVPIAGVLNTRPDDWISVGPDLTGEWVWNTEHGAAGHVRIYCPYIPGEILWVKEAWGIDPNDFGIPVSRRKSRVVYKQDWDDYWWVNGPAEEYHWGWNSPESMPKWASRFYIRIASVTPERLRGTTVEDACREGHSGYYGGVCLRTDIYPAEYEPIPVQEFRSSWDSSHTGEDRWDASPWVWRIEFSAGVFPFAETGAYQGSKADGQA